MIVALFNRYTFLRVAISTLLILFIGCKIATPVFSQKKLSGKEVSIATEENNSEKKSDPNSLEKEKDFANIYSNSPALVMWNTNIVHLTVYSNNYNLSYYQTITIPPPDRS